MTVEALGVAPLSRDRSTMVPLVFLHMVACLGGEIGRHKRLKISRLKGHAGSIPAPGTMST